MVDASTLLGRWLISKSKKARNNSIAVAAMLVMLNWPTTLLQKWREHKYVWPLDSGISHSFSKSVKIRLILIIFLHT